MALYSTAVMDYYDGDASRYIRVGIPGMFGDPWQPAGYPLFLAGVRAVTTWLPATIALQHLLGIATALLLYGAARRAGVSRYVALLPAGFILLLGDYLFLEHGLLQETLWTFLLAASLYATTRGLQTQRLGWIVAASTLLGISGIVRNLSLALPFILAVVTGLAAARPWLNRLRIAAAAAVPGMLVIAVYVLIAASIGPYSGIGEMNGWSLYQRVGQFADCSKFHPPAGTRGLCERRPTSQRPGPYYYYWSLDAPARRVFPGLPPSADGKVGAFARAAIIHQPLDYARTVAKDVVRYFDPNAGFDRVLSGSGPDAMSFHSGPETSYMAAFATNVNSRYYGLDPTPNGGTSFLVTYQAIVRLNGLVLLALIILTIAGVWLTRGLARTTGLLCAIFAALLLVAPPAVASYDARYALPPAALLSLSAALGLCGLLARSRTATGRAI